MDPLAGMKPYFDRLIEIHDLHPADLNAVNRYIESYMSHPPLKNMIGWLLNSISGPDLTAYWARLETIKVKNDLLAVAIARKLGQPVHVKDLYTKKPCTLKMKIAGCPIPGPTTCLIRRTTSFGKKQPYRIEGFIKPLLESTTRIAGGLDFRP